MKNNFQLFLLQTYFNFFFYTMPEQVVGRLASLVRLAVCFLVIKSSFPVIATANDNQGLVQLATKDFGTFIQHTAESAGNVS
jgi:hypothetical protein